MICVGFSILLSGNHFTHKPLLPVAKYDMASIIRQVRNKFKTTNPELYDYLKYFDNTYKGDYKLDDVKSYLISYKTQQNSIPLQNGSGNNYKKSKTRKSKKKVKNFL